MAINDYCCHLFLEVESPLDFFYYQCDTSVMSQMYSMSLSLSRGLSAPLCSHGEVYNLICWLIGWPRTVLHVVSTLLNENVRPFVRVVSSHVVSRLAVTFQPSPGVCALKRSVAVVACHSPQRLRVATIPIPAN